MNVRAPWSCLFPRLSASTLDLSSEFAVPVEVSQSCRRFLLVRSLELSASQNSPNLALKIVGSGCLMNPFFLHDGMKLYPFFHFIAAGVCLLLVIVHVFLCLIQNVVFLKGSLESNPSADFENGCSS